MELVHTVFVGLLVGVLAASVLTFVVMGLRRLKRTRRLARAAHEQHRRFFVDDPFDVPGRYGEFALISAGHSPRADNVTDARLFGQAARAFDFRCELGHGTRRSTRHYTVLAAETARPVGRVIMWHDNDAELAPLLARCGEGHVGPWRYAGDAALAATLARAAGELSDADASIEVRDRVVLLAAPAFGRSGGREVDLPAMEGLLAALQPADAE